MEIQIDESYKISDIAPTDKSAYLEHLNEKQIYDQTLAIPFPYTEADADWWIGHNIEATQRQGGQSVNWVIRRSCDDYLIGGIGFLGLKVADSHASELGYWLAKPYWNKGIMTRAVKKAVEYGFNQLGLVRITAKVFHFNLASARVLEKAGFQCEGYLRNHYKKDGKIFDGKLYAVVRQIHTRTEDARSNKALGFAHSIGTAPTEEVQNTDIKSRVKVLRHSKNEPDRRACLSILEQFLLTNPDEAEAWYDKACCHDFIGEEKEAEPCYQKCFELGWQKLPLSEQMSFFVGYGSTLRNNLKYDESIRVLEEGIKQFPEAPVLQVFLAFSYFSKKMDQKASAILFSATPLLAKFGLDGYDRAIQWYVDNLLTHPEARPRIASDEVTTR